MLNPNQFEEGSVEHALLVHNSISHWITSYNRAVWYMAKEYGVKEKWLKILLVMKAKGRAVNTVEIATGLFTLQKAVWLGLRELHAASFVKEKRRYKRPLKNGSAKKPYLRTYAGSVASLWEIDVKGLEAINVFEEFFLKRVGDIFRQELFMECALPVNKEQYPDKYIDVVRKLVKQSK